MSTKIIIADEHEIFVVGLNHILKSNSEFEIRECFNNGKQVLEFLKEGYDADLLIFDFILPIMDGFQMLGHLQRNFPSLKTLVLSRQYNDNHLQLCRQLGADGLVPKNTSVEELMESINCVLKGQDYFCESQEKQANTSSEDGFCIKMAKDFCLSLREIEILRLILSQYENDEISEKLSLSPFTIRTHRRNIFKKIGVKNWAGLVVLVKNSECF
nr:response regulator [Cytophagales bacterium]